MKNVWHLLISEDAFCDIKDARLYYNSIQKGLGKRFQMELFDTLKKLRSNPYLYGYRYPEFRSASLRIFPYQIHYIVEDKSVLVFAVLFSGRKPSYVVSRIKK